MTKDQKPPLGVRIELEDDAEEIFRAAIEGPHFRPDKVPATHDDRPVAAKKKQRKEPAVQSIDLHGCTLEQAKSQLLGEIDSCLVGQQEPIRFRVITGRGLRSGQKGGVLYREIYAFVQRVYSGKILHIDAAPSEAMVGGIPWRGHFDVVIKS